VIALAGFALRRHLKGAMSQPPSPYEPPASIEPQTARPARRISRVVLAIAGIAILVPCVCCGGIVALMGRGIYVAATERGNVQQVVSDYMENMKSQDEEATLALFSARARRQMPPRQIAEAQNGPLYYLFADYQQATVTKIFVSTAYNTNPDHPQGTIANVEGTVSYGDGRAGTFRGVLEREHNQWRIHVVHVNAPPVQGVKP
jgi:hypothetical protein